MSASSIKMDKRLGALIASATTVQIGPTIPDNRQRDPGRMDTGPLLSIAHLMVHSQWMYFKSGSSGFCYTSHPIQAAPGTKYRRWAAWKVRINKRGGTFSPIGEASYFAHRRVARDRAYKAYQRNEAKRKKRQHQHPHAKTPVLPQSWRNN